MLLTKLVILILGLTSKAERGAVGEATQLWYQLLSTKMDNPIVVKMDHDISRNSALCILPVFESPKFCVNGPKDEQDLKCA